MKKQGQGSALDPVVRSTHSRVWGCYPQRVQGRALAFLLLTTSLAHADTPHALGRYGDWIAATHEEDGRTVCYAFTRAIVSPGDSSVQLIADRGDVVLTVAQRPTERDDVAIAAGFPFRHNQELQLVVRAKSFAFYTAQRNGFARDGSAVVAAFTAGGVAVDHTIGPHGIPVADQFSLTGFPAAYATINAACPDT